MHLQGVDLRSAYQYSCLPPPKLGKLRPLVPILREAYGRIHEGLSQVRISRTSRVISTSAAPSGFSAPFKLNTKAFAAQPASLHLLSQGVVQ